MLAIIITISTAVYQRLTGPTHPKTFHVKDTEYRFELPRSQNGYSDALIRLRIDDPEVNGYIYYKRYPTEEKWDTIYLYRENGELIGWLPRQKAAGKLIYGIDLFKGDQELQIEDREEVIIRYKSEVPVYVLIPHILLIFSAMLFSNLTGMYAMAKIPFYRLYTLITLILFLLGGMILGPIVQKYAFGEFWTGFPLGGDLTDNKALIAFIMWIIAWIGNRKRGDRRFLVIIAAIVTLIVFLIPHSVLGSELDYESGQIKTGMIIYFL